MTYGRVRWYPLETNQKSPASDLLPCNCSFQSPIFWDPQFQDTTGMNLHFASEQQLPPEWSIWTRSRPSGSWILSKSPIDTTNLLKKRTYRDFRQFSISFLRLLNCNHSEEENHPNPVSLTYSGWFLPASRGRVSVLEVDFPWWQEW